MDENQSEKLSKLLTNLGHNEVIKNLKETNVWFLCHTRSALSVVEDNFDMKKNRLDYLFRHYYVYLFDAYLRPKTLNIAQSVDLVNTVYHALIDCGIAGSDKKEKKLIAEYERRIVNKSFKKPTHSTRHLTKRKNREKYEYIISLIEEMLERIKIERAHASS